MGKQNLNIPTLAAARKYTDGSISGYTGVLAGKNCKIQSITPTANNSNIITFAWTKDDGTQKTTDLEVMNGVGITNIQIDPTNNHLKITLSDGTIKDCGKLPSPEPVQLKTMPVADATNKGKVVQYIGNTTPTYTHNFFYECVEDTSTSPSTFSWENVQVQEGGGGSADDHWYGTVAQWDALPQADKEKYRYIHFTDDVASGFMVVSDSVTDGDMNPVTSNAVYDAIQAGGGGGAALTTDVTANLTVGNITSGTKLNQGTTFTEFVQKLLITEIAPTVTFAASGSGVKETGTTVTPTLTLTITASGTGTPTSIKFYDGSTLLDTQTYVAGTNTYTYTMSAISATTTVKGVLEYTKSDTTTASIEKTATYTFVAASYYGEVTTAPTDKAGITALTKNVKNTKSLTATFTLSNQRSCYCYPASFGNLTSIKDANNFEYISSYTKTSVTVDGTAYNVYTLTDPVTATGFKQIYA